MVLGAAIGLRFVLPEFGKLSFDPLDTFHEPTLQLDLRPRSGPIMIMVDYEIAQQDVNTFLSLMSQRRRIRLRDGARQWSLLRDLENPRIWARSEEHTSEFHSLMRTSYAVFCLKKKK